MGVTRGDGLGRWDDVTAALDALNDEPHRGSFCTRDVLSIALCIDREAAGRHGTATSAIGEPRRHPGSRFGIESFV